MRYRSLFISCPLLAISTGALDNLPPQFHTQERRSLMGLPGGGQSSQSSQSQVPPQYPSAPVNSSCKPLPFTNQTWTSLKLDEYLLTYPGGDHLSVSQYAASKGVSNFDCGFGNKCHAGQLCYPLALRDWYVLFATQQWNAHVNSMISAISFGISFVQATISTIMSALFPAVDPSGVEVFKLNFGVNGAFMMVSNTILIDIMALFNAFQLGINMFFNVVNNLATAAFYGVAGLIPMPKDTAPEAFNQWAHLADNLAKYEELLIDGIANETQKVLDAGISTPQGLAGVLKNGTYIAPVDGIYLPEVEASLKNVTMALFLVQVLRSMDAFVTIGSDVCNGKGKNGALEGEDKLSYCDPSGTMYNIVRVGKKDKEQRGFPNAYVIDDRLGYSTQFLTNASVFCQQKYGGFEHFPYNHTTVPPDPSADCVINLPVCDCRNPQTKNAIKKHGVVQACREVGLPI